MGKADIAVRFDNLVKYDCKIKEDAVADAVIVEPVSTLQFPALSQVSEIADEVCDGMLVTSAAMLLKNRDGLGGPRDVVGFIRHTFPSD
jgi:hypothetical protein